MSDIPTVDGGLPARKYEPHEVLLQSRVERLVRDQQSLAADLSAWISVKGSHALSGIAEAIPDGHMLALVLRLTPRHGEVFAEHRKPNRTERRAHVQALKRDMTGYNWQLNGQTISFAAGTGEMEDGNHRSAALAACPDGTAIQQLCAFGVEEEETIDAGLSRQLSDTLSRLGFRNAKNLAAFAVRAEAMDRGHFRINDGGTARRPSRFEMVEYIEAHREYEETVAKVKHAVPEWCSPAIAAACLLMLQRAAAGLGEPEKADVFYAYWQTGLGLMDQRDPVYLLRGVIGNRRFLVDPKAGHLDRKKAPSYDDIVAYVALAWNAWIAGRRQSRLAMTPGGATNANFPVPTGYKAWEKQRDAAKARDAA